MIENMAAKNFRFLWKFHKDKQTELAKMFCVSQSDISAYVNGKHPYGVKFDDESCNNEFYTNGIDSREQCYKVIEKAKSAGYDIDSEVDEYFY